ncbi:hypothetical protein [Tepidimonas aquatica]|uniref:Toxin CptA n=1 Tax=Tepidimonas aquatica TaxID=247482 RepID=A0A554WLF0_9BURK|nr:hypothetical protein [Tepidimonas aquatica]TSE24403.1 hypothetical protein Taqua_01549 [Tepidimonas aquatica]
MPRYAAAALQHPARAVVVTGWLPVSAAAVVLAGALTTWAWHDPGLGPAWWVGVAASLGWLAWAAWSLRHAQAGVLRWEPAPAGGGVWRWCPVDRPRGRVLVQLQAWPLPGGSLLLRAQAPDGWVGWLHCTRGNGDAAWRALRRALTLPGDAPAQL